MGPQIVVIVVAWLNSGGEVVATQTGTAVSVDQCFQVASTNIAKQLDDINQADPRALSDDEKVIKASTPLISCWDTRNVQTPPSKE